MLLAAAAAHCLKLHSEFCLQKLGISSFCYNFGLLAALPEAKQPANQNCIAIGKKLTKAPTVGHI